MSTPFCITDRVGWTTLGLFFGHPPLPSPLDRSRSMGLFFAVVNPLVQLNLGELRYPISMALEPRDEPTIHLHFTEEALAAFIEVWNGNDVRMLDDRNVRLFLSHDDADAEGNSQLFITAEQVSQPWYKRLFGIR